MRLYRALSVVVGLVLLAGVVFWIGPAELLRQLVMLGWIFPVLLVFGLVKHALRTSAWKEALEAEGVAIEFRELFRVRVISQSLAYFSSMGGLVGDPIKPWLLRRTAAVETTLPATFVEAALYWFTSLCVAAAGAFVVITIAANQYNAFLLSLICLAISGGIVLLLFGRTPLLPKLTAFASRRWPLRQSWATILRKGGELEGRMRTFRLRHPGPSSRMLGLDLFVQAIMLAEVWIVLSAAGLSIDFFLLLAIEGASRVVKTASFYIPGRLGADEAGAAASFLLLGLDPAAGLTLAIARRIAGLCWAGIGLAWLSFGAATIGHAGAHAAETTYQPLAGDASSPNETQGVF